MITAIVAYNRDFVIGDASGQVPWRIKEDLKFFKQTTSGHPVIMGRRTWDSIPPQFQPLPDRHNIVVSRNHQKFVYPKSKDCLRQITVLPTIEESIDWAKRQLGGEEVFIIGGGQIYSYCIDHDLVDRVLASEVKGHMYVEAATFFPSLNQLGWTSTLVQELSEFSVIDYRRPIK